MHSRLFLILLVSVISKSFYANGVKQTESLLENRFLLLDNQTPPKLVYICLKNDFPIDLNQTRHEVEKIAELDWEKNFSRTTNRLTLSTISSSSINEWLTENYLQNIETNLFLQSFLYQESSKIEDFLVKQRQVELEELAIINQKLEDRNLSSPLATSPPSPDLSQKQSRSTDAEGGLAKFALYLILGGGACIIYSVLSPVGTGKQGVNRDKKIVLARRKRWLEKIFSKGWIDRPTYHFLLRKIENLPKWLGGITPPVQSEDFEFDEEPAVDLSRRNSGESVVKTKDTSLDKTSR